MKADRADTETEGEGRTEASGQDGRKTPERPGLSLSLFHAGTR